MERGNYKRFLLMVIASFFVMYAVMFLNVYSFGHVYFSIMHLSMVLLMVSPMAIIMLAFMRGMYKDKKLNRIIIIISIIVFALALIFLRTQAFIGDEQYLRDMIPHHSSAILTSSEANIQDPEVKALAEQIIESQGREIEQMKSILDRLG